jgi:thiosulfate/3-mercaptopyruvate sulfurtransferase
MAALATGILLIVAVIGRMISYGAALDPVEPVDAAPVPAEAHHVLVDAAWLSARMDGSDAPVIIDVSERKRYDMEHIPGAIHLSWQDTMNINGAGYGEAIGLGSPHPSVPEIPAAQDDLIVVYDNDRSLYASRIAWHLRASGYSRAVVLDGGLAAWKGAGHAVTSEIPDAPTLAATPADHWEPDAEVTVDQVQTWLDDPNLAIVDSRTPEQRQDTVNDTVRLGTIPGSIHVPATSVLQPTGTFKSPEQLVAQFTNLGLSPEQTVVVYGRFGVESGQVWLALTLAGFEDVRVLDDGWIAWGHDEARPIEPVG